MAELGRVRRFSLTAIVAFACVVGIVAITSTPDSTEFRAITDSSSAGGAAREIHVPTDAAAVFTRIERHQSSLHRVLAFALIPVAAVAFVLTAVRRRRDRRRRSLRAFMTPLPVRRRGPPLLRAI